MGDAIFYSYEPTDLVTSVYTDGWNDVDVRIDVNTWGTGVYGYVYCPSDGIRTGSDPNETCYRQWVKIDLAHAGGFNADQRKLLMCHEFGHTLGLRHAETDPFYPAPDDTCMRTLIRGGPGMTHPQDALFSLHAHDTVHLNALY